MGGVRVGVPTAAGQVNPFANAKIDFDRNEFDAAIEDKGYDVTWEKAAVCPNRPRDGISPTAHDVNCNVCDGTGFVFFSSCKTDMLFAALSYDEAFQGRGEWGRGMARVTARPGFRLSYWDRISLNHGLARFTETVLRQPSGPDYPKYKPICVEYVAWVDRNKSLQVFDPSVVSVSSEGTLSWSGVRPDANSLYTIVYEYRPRFVVWDLPHQIRESTIDSKQVEFSVSAVVKADFLVRDESRDPPMVRDENPFTFR